MTLEGHLRCTSQIRTALYWWLVRVTLVVDWLFLPQNFGPVVGTYEGLLRLCECTLGGGSICRWWGHLTTISGNRSFFLPQVVGTLKPSIISFHLSRPCLAPVLLPVSPLSRSLSHPLSRSLSHPLSRSLSRPCLAPCLIGVRWWGP